MERLGDFSLFGCNQMEEEIRRLFQIYFSPKETVTSPPPPLPPQEEVNCDWKLFPYVAHQDDATVASDDAIPFHLNGTDSEYCPDFEDGFQNFVHRTRKEKKKKSSTECVFCKNNNEPPKVYRSHVLKDPLGRTTCPILRNYTCPICKTRGGDLAHTIKYCPVNRNMGIMPSASNMLRTPRTSTGLRKVRQNMY